jgi:hypothetical protein
MRVIIGVLILLVVGCGPGRRSDDDPGNGSGGGGDTLIDAAVTAPCPDIDLLFVIDDSGSMADQQQSLIASFPGFAAAIQSRLGSAQSYHIGVVTTEDYQPNPVGCRTIGDLITQTGGPESSARACGPYYGGTTWIGNQEPNLADKFACAGKVGAGGNSDERVARALMNALHPAKSDPGACNAGFSRKNAMLVVVIITDEDDVEDGCDGMGMCMSYGSGGTSTEWFNTVVAHRGGIASNIVVLSLIGRQANNPCGAVPASRLLGFTNKFGPNGFIGDVCAASYDQFFVDALPVIDTACQKFEPIL